MPRILYRLSWFTAGLGLALCSAAISPRHASAQTKPTPIHDVNNPVEKPFFRRFYPSAGSAATYQVPAGMRLLITDVSGFSYGSTTVEDIAVYTQAAGVGTARTIPFTTNNHGIVYAGSPVSIVADAGSTVTVAIDDANGSDAAGMNVDVHGYFVPHQ